MARDILARKREPITYERAATLLRYDPDTGLIYWREPTWRCKNAEGIAGSIHATGYWQVKADKQVYLGHRLAWLLHFGRWPEQHIDHMNGVRTDNRIANLRDVSINVNMQNVVHAKTGRLRGVTRSTDGSGKFEARIRDGDRLKYLGRYETEQAAHAVYIEAKKTLHAGFNVERLTTAELL